jgi:type VI secretion system secreted protein Hcp
MAIYVQIDGIQGDATHETHKKWVDVAAMNWGVHRAVTTPSGSAQNREASEPVVGEVHLTKSMDGSSLKFFEAAATGNQGKTVTIHLVTTGSPGSTYMEYKLTNALVSGYQVNTQGDRPVEEITLNFTKVDLKYTTYDENHKPVNNQVASYDIATTKKG